MSEMKFSKKTVFAIIIPIIIVIIIFFLLVRGCTNKIYTVTFDSSGGSIIESIKVRKNEKINMPTDPKKKGYSFVGWYYENKLFDFNTKITKDMTLKAHWTKSDLELNSTSINLMVGSSDKIEFLSLPNGLNIDDFTFSSSNKDIVTVDENGNIKAIKNGTAIITIKSKDGKYETICKITVTEKLIEIESVTINGASQVDVGSNIKLSVTFKPDNATNGKLKWENSDNSIATVDENGNVKGIKAGTVTITVKTENGKTATKKITIKEVKTSQSNNSNNNNSSNTKPSGNTGGNTTPSKPSEVLPTSVSISGANTVIEGNTIQLTVTVLPSNATNKNVTWRSNDNSIASVDQTGKVTGNRPGSTTITVTTSNGKVATHSITVIEKESTYDLYLTPNTMGGTGNATQYNYEVRKDGKTFTDYIGFYFVDRYIGPDSGTIDSVSVKANGNKSVTLTLKDNKTATMSVHVNG